MKYIITEQQMDRVKEKNWIDFFTQVIGRTCDQIQSSCSEISADNFPTDLSFDTCEDIERLERIEVDSVTFNKSNDGTIPNFTLTITIYFNSRSFRNFESLLYDMSGRFRKIIGTNITWKVQDEINHYDSSKFDM